MKNNPYILSIGKPRKKCIGHKPDWRYRLSDEGAYWRYCNICGMVESESQVNSFDSFFGSKKIKDLWNPEKAIYKFQRFQTNLINSNEGKIYSQK